MLVSAQILKFFKSLEFPAILPEDVQVMNPYADGEAFQICERFYHKFYGDNNPRQIVIGINPGRFGGGVTGIPFTDPIRLADVCGIKNNWPRKQELSSLFVYDVINAFGGPENFYSKFYISAVSPLGFTKHNKNLNYYDDKELQRDIESFAVDCIHKQFQFGIDQEVAFCLGDGKNFKFLSKLSEKYNLFGKVVPLPHPRFIMQYKLKKKQEYIDLYIERLGV